MELEKKVSDIDHKVSGIDQNVTTILHLLTGTHLDKNQGLLFEFNEERERNILLEKRVTKLEKWRDRIIWMMVGMALPTGYGIAGIVHILFSK